MIYPKLLVIVILLATCCLTIQGQPPLPRFAHFGAREGLSQSIVHKIIQDKAGYMWFATEEGLNRFDGYNFKVYKKNYRPGALPWSNIADILQDSLTGNILVATEGKGLYSLDVSSETFTKILTVENKQTEQVAINAVCTTEHFIWAVSAGYATGINRANNRVSFNIKVPGNATQVIDAGNNIIWVFTKGGDIYIINEKLRAITQSFTSKDLFGAGIKTETGNVFVENKKVVWICTLHGLYTAPLDYNSLKTGLRKVPLLTDNGKDYTEKYIYSAFSDAHQNRWIGVDSVGVLFKRPGDTRYYVISKRISNPYSLADNYIRQVYEDKMHNLWFATEKGVDKLIKLPAFLKTVGAEITPGDDKLNRIFSICTLDERHLILGRLSNIVIFDTLTNNVTDFVNKSKYDPERIYFTYPLNKKTFLTGCKRGIRILECQHNKYILKDADDITELKGLQGKKIAAIAQVDKDNFLLGGLDGGGLHWWNRSAHTLQSFYNNAGSSSSLINNSVICIKKAEDGDFWIGTNNGISKFSTTTGRFVNYHLKVDSLQGEARINSIFESNGTLWLAVYGTGIAALDIQKQKLLVYAEKDGLNNVSISNMLPDDRGNLWLTTDAGISVFSINTKIFINYTVTDGIQDNEFNRFAVFSTPCKMYFGGISGFNIINKPLIAWDEKITPAAISAISYLDKNRYVSLPYAQGAVSLTHQFNNLIIQFSMLDFSVNYRTEYMYKMDGIDKEWILNGLNNSVTYTNLAPGNYTFRVKPLKKNINNKSNKDVITSLPIYIIPAWYQTWWFRFLEISLAAGIIIFILALLYNARLRKQKAILEKKLAIQYERQRISAEMHDDIGAGLSGIRLMAEMIGLKTNGSQIHTDVAEIYGSLNDLSEKMKEVIWSLDDASDNLENLISYIQKQAGNLYKHATARLVIELPDVVPGVNIGSEKRKNIYLAVKEALHNSLKYSAAQQVNVIIATNEHWLTITVRDNGRGFNIPEKEHVGNGLQNMRRRMLQAGGEFKIYNSNGITIQFVIPI